MNARDDQVLLKKLKSLSPQRRTEVEDFVDFLKSREDEQRLTRAAAQASEPAFKRSGTRLRSTRRNIGNLTVDVPTGMQGSFTSASPPARLALTSIRTLVFGATHSEHEERWFTGIVERGQTARRRSHVPKHRSRPGAGAAYFSAPGHTPRT